MKKEIIKEEEHKENLNKVAKLLNMYVLDFFPMEEKIIKENLIKIFKEKNDFYLQVVTKKIFKESNYKIKRVFSDNGYLGLFKMEFFINEEDIKSVDVRYNTETNEFLDYKDAMFNEKSSVLELIVKNYIIESVEIK